MLFLQKKCKIFERWGSVPRPLCLGRLGVLPIDPQPPLVFGRWRLCPQTPKLALPTLQISGYAPGSIFGEDLLLWSSPEFGEKKCSIFGEDLFFALHLICSREKNRGRGSSPPTLKIGQIWGKIGNYPPNAQQRFAPLYAGTVRLFFCDGTGTVRWYAV